MDRTRNASKLLRVGQAQWRDRGDTLLLELLTILREHAIVGPRTLTRAWPTAAHRSQSHRRMNEG